MTAQQAIDRLHALLAEERAAIKSIDAITVEALAMEKAMLLRAFNRDLLRADPEMASQFREVATLLRNNAVILAHARNCLRDVVRLRAPAPSTYSAQGRLGSHQAGRLSITG